MTTRGRIVLLTVLIVSGVLVRARIEEDEQRKDDVEEILRNFGAERGSFASTEIAGDFPMHPSDVKAAYVIASQD